MKKVTLLGDSIRLIGYGNAVPALLGSDYTVWQPTDNCRFAAYTQRVLFEYQNEIQNSDIIHFNCGLWDVFEVCDGVFTPLDVYVSQMRRITAQMLKITDRVIFSTTTPVTERNANIKIETIRQYNAAVVPELEKMGVRINDLFTPVFRDVDRYIRSDDNIHLTEDGIALAAKLVADAIRSVG